MSIKQAFLNYKNKLKEIKIEELGVSVYVAKWSGKDRARVITKVGDIEKLGQDKMIKAMTELVLEFVKDENGNRVFEDSDLKTLMEFDGEIIQRIFEEIMNYNGLGDPEVKEAAKN